MLLHHLALGAQEVASLAKFYSTALELPVVAEHEDEAGVRAIWLDLGTGVLMIERTLRERPEVEGVDRGLFLLAFRVDAAERASRERLLVDAGAVREERSRYSTYFRDLEGNRFAISCYPLPPIEK